MGGGYLFVKQMQDSLKNNRRLLGKKSSVATKKEYADYAANNTTILTFKEATEEDLIKIRMELKRQRRINMWKNVAAMLFSLVLTGWVFYILKQIS